MILSRRRTVIAFGAVVGTAGCTQLEAIVNNAPALETANLRLLAGYTSAISTGLNVVVPFIVGAKMLGAGDAANIVTGLTALTSAAQTVGKSSALNDAPTINAVKLIVEIVEADLAVAAALPLPSTVHLVLLAAAALLPIMTSLVGLFITPSQTSATAAATIPPEAAQSVLNNSAVTVLAQ